MSLRGVRRLFLRRARPDERMSVVAHLSELRARLVVSLIALVVAFGGVYAVRDPVLDFLLRPLPAKLNDQLTTFSPQEPFFTTIKVCLAVALLVVLPLWLYQLYAFVIPAVGDQPRVRTLLIVGLVSLLFLGGVAFGYFIILPTALDFLLAFGGDNFNTELRASSYFGFVTALLLATGAIFEVPVGMVALSSLGVVSADRFKKGRRYAVLVIAVVAAILPGGDPITMLLLMAPQLVLYEVGIVLAGVVERRGRRSADQAVGAPSSP